MTHRRYPLGIDEGRVGWLRLNLDPSDPRLVSPLPVAPCFPGSHPILWSRVEKECLGCRTMPPLDDERPIETTRIIPVRWVYSRTSLQGKVHPTIGTDGESLLLKRMVPSPFQASKMLSYLEEKYERERSFVVHANLGRIDAYKNKRHAIPKTATTVESGTQARFLGRFGWNVVPSIDRTLVL